MSYAALADSPCIHSAEALRTATDRLEQAVARFQQLLEGLTEAQLRFRLSSEPHSFSMKENILHLRDIEAEGYSVRLRRIRDEETPALPDLDGGRMALERRYNEQLVEPAFAEFVAARRENIRLLRGCAPEELERTAELETVGHITLGQLVQMWLNHDAGHLAEMTELRRVVECR